MSPGPAYHARTHAPGGTDPIPGGGHGPWIELDMVNGFTSDPPVMYRHAPGSPGANGNDWELEWRGHAEGPSGTYCGILPEEDRPPIVNSDETDDKYGEMAGEDPDTGDPINVLYYIQASTGYVFIDFPVGGPSGDANTADPWLVQIVPIGAYTVVAGTWTRSHDNSVVLGSYIYNGDNVNPNDEVTWPVVLSAGTWTIELIHHKASVRGIYTFSIDGSSVGTIDGYAGGPTVDQVGTITGITVASSGKKTLSVKSTTKNASATKYGMIMSLISLIRTA